MKIKVGSQWFEATAEEPIMVVLSEKDKQNIANMHPAATQYAEFVDDALPNDCYAWMTEPMPEKKLGPDFNGVTQAVPERFSTEPVPCPEKGTIWRHKKRGTTYEVVGKVRLQCSTYTPQDGDMLVLYVVDEDVFSARHPDEFLDGRFEKAW